MEDVLYMEKADHVTSCRSSHSWACVFRLEFGTLVNDWFLCCHHGTQRSAFNLLFMSDVVCTFNSTTQKVEAGGRSLEFKASLFFIMNCKTAEARDPASKKKKPTQINKHTRINTYSPVVNCCSHTLGLVFIYVLVCMLSWSSMWATASGWWMLGHYLATC